MFCFQKWFMCSIRFEFQRKTGSTGHILNRYGVLPEQWDPLQTITGRHVTVPYQFTELESFRWLTLISWTESFRPVLVNWIWIVVPNALLSSSYFYRNLLNLTETSFAQIDLSFFKISMWEGEGGWSRDSVHVKVAGEPILLTWSYERLNLSCHMPDHGPEMLRLSV